MNKLFIKAPLVLGAICVVSAGLIGGVHSLTSWYAETHKSSDAPKEIQALDPTATFTEVEGFQPISVTGDVTKVTIEAVYMMSHNGARTGYAYSVNAGKPVKTDVTFTVAYKGDISQETVTGFRPYNINVTVGGDSGYDANIIAYAAGIVSGAKEFDDNADIVSGGTKSQKFLRDGLIAARNDYLARWNGEEPGPGPSGDVPASITKMYPNYKSVAKDEEFSALSFSSTFEGHRASGKVTDLYRVTLEDDSIAYAYRGFGDDIWVSDYQEETCQCEMFVSFEGPVEEGKESAIKVAKYDVGVDTNFSYSEWENIYLPGILDGSLSLESSSDIKTGATVASGFVRAMIRKMRNAYYNTVLEEQKSQVESHFKKIYGEAYSSYEADETFVAIEKGELANKYKSLQITDKFDVTTSSGIATVYKGSVKAMVDEYEQWSELEATLFVGFSASGEEITDINADGYSLVSSSFSMDDWKAGYLDKIISGEKDLDNSSDLICGATYSSTALNELLKEMRSAYFATLVK